MIGLRLARIAYAFSALDGYQLFAPNRSKLLHQFGYFAVGAKLAAIVLVVNNESGERQPAYIHRRYRAAFHIREYGRG